MTKSYEGFWLGTAGSEVLMSANDCNIDITYEDISNEVRTASGTLKRFKVAKKMHAMVNYSWIYGHQRDQYDGGMGYNELLTLYQADNEMSFLRQIDNGNGQQAHTVRFAKGTWRARIVFRTPDAMAWSLNYELVEV